MEDFASQVEVEMDGKFMEAVIYFKYMDGCYNGDRSQVGSVKMRVNNGLKTFSEIKKIGDVKTVSLGVMREPAVTCGTKTWGWRKEVRHRFDVIEMKRLQIMCGVTRMVNVKNEEMRHIYWEK